MSTKDSEILRSMSEANNLYRKAVNEGFDRVTASIEALTLNIAQLTSQQKATAYNIDKLTDRLDRITVALEAQIRLSQSQSENIAELTKLATALATRS